MWRISFALVIVGLCVNTAAGLPGSGTQQDPWRIESLADFDEFAADANYWDDYTRLETDVNLAGRTYTNAVIAPDTNNSDWQFDGIDFMGVFDGNNHKITNLTIDDGGTGNDYLGLFGSIGEYGEVVNLGLEGGSVSGDELVGGLAAMGSVSITKNCYFTGNVSGNWGVGGLVGVWSGNVENCYFTGSVIGSWMVGGLLSGGGPGFISNCYSTGDVNGVEVVGGLVGINGALLISNCYSTSDVKGANDIGGLVGYNAGDGFLNQPGYIFNSYSTGSVHGTSYVGGLVGRNAYYGSVVLNCYSTGSVSGYNYIGGLVGENYDDGIISNCYSIGDVNGVQYVGGLVGWNYQGGISNNSFWDTDTQTHGVTESIGVDQGTTTNVSGLPTAQMQTRSTFTSAGWDFVEIWLINDGATYPVLRQEIRSDLNGDGRVDFADFAIFADHWLEGTGI
ncbi:MAG: hypothetical protein FVQ85_13840 [Planctomycetes bacterium]|nr:hypothetical protein [Planctomycetota bacterium]